MASNLISRLASGGFNFRNWILIGVVFELLIFAYSYFFYEGVGEVFRHAARYSGRLSLFVYLFAFSFFALTFHDEAPGIMPILKKIVTIFCLLHFIHFGFLATNILLNGIEVVPYRLAGGILAYLMILLYPFLMDRIKNKKLHFIYFLYLNIIFIGTYVARIKGESPGVIPSPIHYFGIIVTVLALLAYGFMIFRARTQVQGKEV